MKPNDGLINEIRGDIRELLAFHPLLTNIERENEKPVPQSVRDSFVRLIALANKLDTSPLDLLPLRALSSIHDRILSTTAELKPLVNPQLEPNVRDGFLRQAQNRSDSLIRDVSRYLTYLGEASPTQSTSTSLLTVLPSWVLTLTVLVYVTGFLALLMFHESYGIRVLDETYLKLRFAYLGILCLMPIGMLAFSTFAVFEYVSYKKAYKRGEIGRDSLHKRLHPSIVITLNCVAAIFYVLLAYTPPGSFGGFEAQSILATTLLIAFGLRYVSIALERDGNREGAIFARRVQCAGIIAMLGFCVFVYRNPILALLCSVSAWYFILSVLLGFSAFALRTRLRSIYSTDGSRLWQLQTIGVIASYYFFAIVVFGHGVIHYIPSGKGGGDFSRAQLIHIEFTKTPSLPSWLSTENESHKWILIEGTNSTLYVTNPMLNGGPTEWRKGFTFRPPIYEIPSSTITGVEYLHETADDLAMWNYTHPQKQNPQKQNPNKIR